MSSEMPLHPPLEPFMETKRGTLLPLPPRLARLYGCLRMPRPRSRPYVFSNFVTTLDGVVSLNEKGHASGGDISANHRAAQTQGFGAP